MSDSLVRRAMTSMLVVLGCLVVSFVIVRLYEGVQFQRRIAVLQVRVDVLEQAIQRHEDEDAQRLDWMEAFVFGRIMPSVEELQTKPAPRSSAETWQVNRDRILRERLRRLEEWRLSLLKDPE